MTRVWLLDLDNTLHDAMAVVFPRIDTAMTDYMARLDRSPAAPDHVAGGDPSRPIESEEVWTFVRRRGGTWLLSAIQQV